MSNCYEFDKYVSNYDFNDLNIKLKYYHSYRVMKLGEKYSQLIGFNDDEIKLATTIGLIHDIGRFEQFKRYNTFFDKKSVDHADLGCEILFENNLIKNFWSNEKDYDTIYFSIKNHNKLDIPKTDDELMIKQAKLIRDIDKLDILYLRGYLKEVKFRTSNDKISPKVLDAIIEHKSVNISDINNTNDSISCNFAFAFDINNDELIDELKRNITYFYNSVNHDNIFDEIYSEIINYLNERKDKYVKHKVQSLRS